MHETLQKNILHELKIIKRLLAHNIVSGATQVTQISRLSSIGFQPKEIAEILGTTSNTVNVALNRLRNAKQKH
jgi:DNA-binding NarL/FixJ family response regulator